MSLPSRRSLAEARIAAGPFDRFYFSTARCLRPSGAPPRCCPRLVTSAVLGVASRFLPAILHELGFGPSEIGAVLAAGTAIRLITGPVISRLADRLGKHQQNPTRCAAPGARLARGVGV